jgi:2-dehydro-3-deoxy-D-arabinonate dehydratase
VTIDGLLGGPPGALAAALGGAAAGPVPVGVRVVAPVGGQEVWAAGVGFVNGTDMSSRSVEGENPLYLPQAKIYSGSCALGPCLATPDEVPELASLLISLRVVRDGAEVVADTVEVADLHRSPGELVAWLFRAMGFPVGVVLLTGTAIVPPPGFTLRAGDEVIIATTGPGELRNVVEVIKPSLPAGGG